MTAVSLLRNLSQQCQSIVRTKSNKFLLPLQARRQLSTTVESEESLTHLAGHTLDDADCNVPANVASRVGRNLHCQPLHPLHTIQAKIQDYWGSDYVVKNDLSPIVSTWQNFDQLGFPADHVSRGPCDTYYLNQETVLRTHTSAHQIDLLSQGLHQFLVVGDVYRRDEIDKSHYPVFHQTEGVKIFDPTQLSSLDERAQTELIVADLKQNLEGLARHLFGSNTEMRWNDEYFPFTHPSFELEIYFQDEWMEVLGCGMIHPNILRNAGRPTDKGWAFGLGLERLAMILFQIPDIRLFWTADERFHSQFASGEIIQFQSYSKYPPCYKDISFWIPLDRKFHANDLNELVRSIAGDLVEQLELIDDFTHPKTKKASHCYRISYRSMDRSLTNEEIDSLQEEVRERTARELGVELR